MRTKRTGTDIGIETETEKGTEKGTEIEKETGTGTVIAMTDTATIEDETSVDVLALVTDVPHRLLVLYPQKSQFRLLHRRMKS